jgi:hypothetical protein
VATDVLDGRWVVFEACKDEEEEEEEDEKDPVRKTGLRGTAAHTAHMEAAVALDEGDDECEC